MSTRKHMKKPGLSCYQEEDTEHGSNLILQASIKETSSRYSSSTGNYLLTKKCFFKCMLDCEGKDKRYYALHFCILLILFVISTSIRKRKEVLMEGAISSRQRIWKRKSLVTAGKTWMAVPFSLSSPLPSWALLFSQHHFHYKIWCCGSPGL